MIIKYHNLTTTWESKEKAIEEREAKLKEKMTTLYKSCNSRVAGKEKVLSWECGWAVDTQAKLDHNEVFLRLAENKAKVAKG